MSSDKEAPDAVGPSPSHIESVICLWGRKDSACESPRSVAASTVGGTGGQSCYGAGREPGNTRKEPSMLQGKSHPLRLCLELGIITDALNVSSTSQRHPGIQGALFLAAARL
jgi:hypothetical protein